MDLQIHNSEQLLWSDVLHYSWLAENSHDSWDYNSSIRSMIITGHIVIELITSRLSGCVNLGYSFRKNLDDHNMASKLPEIDWSSGWGKSLSEFISERKEIVHLSGKKNIMKFFYDNGKHLEYLNKARSVLKGIGQHYSSTESWWDEDQYEEYKESKMTANLSLKMKGYRDEDGHEIGYVRGEREIVYGHIPPSASKEQFGTMKSSLRGPVTKAYIKCKGNIIYEEEYYSRGV